MAEMNFPSALDILRHLEIAGRTETEDMRLYSRSVDFVHRFWPAMDMVAAQAGHAVSEGLYEYMKTVEGIESFIQSNRDTAEAESLESYLHRLPGYPDAVQSSHALVMTQIDAALLAALPPNEAYRRLADLKRENERQARLIKRLMSAIHPFANAFEATGLHSYADAEPDYVRFLDRNQVIPMSGLTMGSFRQIWEVSRGFEATKSPVVLVGVGNQNVGDSNGN